MNMTDLTKVNIEDLFLELNRRMQNKEAKAAWNSTDKEIWIINWKIIEYKKQGEKFFNANEMKAIIKWDMGSQGWSFVPNEDWDNYKVWRLWAVMNGEKLKDQTADYLNFLVQKGSEGKIKIGLGLVEDEDKKDYFSCNWFFIIKNMETGNELKSRMNRLPEIGQIKWFDWMFKKYE